jgi:hypothetical protein
VTISCLVSDLVFEWRLAMLDGGAATSITVHVEIPEAEAHRLAAQQDVISKSLSRLAALAAAESRLAKSGVAAGDVAHGHGDAEGRARGGVGVAGPEGRGVADGVQVGDRLADRGIIGIIRAGREAVPCLRERERLRPSLPAA